MATKATAEAITNNILDRIAGYSCFIDSTDLVTLHRDIADLCMSASEGIVKLRESNLTSEGCEILLGRKTRTA